MSATTALLLVAACWLLLGLASAVVLGRRGHDPFTWLAVGAALGPLSIPLGVLALRGDHGQKRQLAAGRAGTGPVDVLVGIDGSPAAGATLATVLDLLGPRIGRLTLAAVAELDDTAAERAHQRALGAELERQAAVVQARRRPIPGGEPAAGRPELVLLTGEPAAGPGSPPPCSAAWRPGWPPRPSCPCWSPPTGPPELPRSAARRRWWLSRAAGPARRHPRAA